MELWAYPIIQKRKRCTVNPGFRAGAEDNIEMEIIKRHKVNGRFSDDIELTENGNRHNPSKLSIILGVIQKVIKKILKTLSITLKNTGLYVFETCKCNLVCYSKICLIKYLRHLLNVYLGVSVDNEPIKKVRGPRLLVNHIKAMFMKLAFSTWRSKVTSSIQLSWPIINIVISIILSRSWQFLAELPALTLNLETGFKRTQTIVAHGVNLTDGSLEAKAMAAYKAYFKTSSYPGMTLTDIGPGDMEFFYMNLVSL